MGSAFSVLLGVLGLRGNHIGAIASRQVHPLLSHREL